MTYIHAPVQSGTTVTFYALEQLTGQPVERLPDVVPGLSMFRITLTLTLAEDYEQSWTVTERTLIDGTQVTTGRARQLRKATYTGELAPMPAIAPVPPFGNALPRPSPEGFRPDLDAVKRLEQLAARDEPIMVVSPRDSFPRCVVERVSRSWTNDTGETTPIVVAVREYRTVGRRRTRAAMDTDALAAGNVHDNGQAGSSGNVEELANVDFGSAGGSSASAGPGAPVLGGL